MAEKDRVWGLILDVLDREPGSLCALLKVQERWDELLALRALARPDLLIGAV